MSTFVQNISIAPKSRKGILRMKVTVNMVKARIAKLHKISQDQVVMDTLLWKVLVEGHAAYVRYDINGEKLSPLPYSAVVIDNEIFLWESRNIHLEVSADIGKTIGEYEWIRLSDDSRIDGSRLLQLIDMAKGQLELDILNVQKVVKILNDNPKMCNIDQNMEARKYGMTPFHDQTADKLFYNDSFVISYDSKERCYRYNKF